MIKVIATNITSPLGRTTEENYQTVRSGGSVLSTYQQWNGLSDPFASSMFTAEQTAVLQVADCTRFESMAIRSIEEALSQTSVKLSDRTILILSTTKGNVEELAEEAVLDGNYLHPGQTAKKISQHFGLKNDPIVVCNACISGVSGMLLAQRLLTAKAYDTAIVCGADCVTPFIVGGFLSFKALSPYPCRPFDIERLGLNVGEAAATVCLQRCEDTEEDAREDTEEAAGWILDAGCANNDAYHVSAPSPVGEGTYRAIEKTLTAQNIDDLALVCVHGTATMFNDQMESKAIQKAGLSDVPLSALKGYYGHTMGAAGLLETILTMRSLDEGRIIANKGFEEIGVSGKVNIRPEEGTTDKTTFLKIISGFGGCNASLLCKKVPSAYMSKKSTAEKAPLTIRHRVQLTESSLTIDRRSIPVTATGKDLLTEIYKTQIGNYPKYYKMDMLCRLVFVASELLIQQESAPYEGEDKAIVLFNRTSSIVSDRKHLKTMHDDGIPSPSVFLYTLPNIVNGEIAIKHQLKGETSFYIFDEKNEQLMQQIIDVTMQQSDIRSMLTGWVDCSEENRFEADLCMIEKA